MFQLYHTGLPRYSSHPAAAPAESGSYGFRMSTSVVWSGAKLSSWKTNHLCGSLFLAGEALVELGAYPWGTPRFDKSELLRA